MNSKHLSFLFIIIITATSSIQAQNSENLNFIGDARFSYMSTSTDAVDIVDGTAYLRVRVGATYKFDSHSIFRARLATTQSDEFPPVSFTLKPDGGGLNPGSISFDQFYYNFKNDEFDIKAGRFQHSANVRSNAGRSIFRFQSNNINNHWVDGIHIKKYLNEEWIGEVVGEYQNRGNTSYSYGGKLDFGKNTHNFAAYAGAENEIRDELNFIQKGFGLFYAPASYAKAGGYSYYLAFMSRLVYDLPRELLNGGSFRIAGEAGQNLNSGNFQNGNILNLSLGIHNYAEKHQFMVEFTKTGSDWLTANVYAPNADEIEIRYRFFFSKKLNIDFRYRIRESRNELIGTNYNFFARATYSL